MTNGEIAAGATALEAYAEGQNWWKAHFAEAQAPNIWRDGAIDIIRAADGAKDQTPLGRQIAATLGLHTALRAVDHENALSVQQYHDAAAVVLAAVHKIRG